MVCSRYNSSTLLPAIIIPTCNKCTDRHLANIVNLPLLGCTYSKNSTLSSSKGLFPRGMDRRMEEDGRKHQILLIIGGFIIYFNVITRLSLRMKILLYIPTFPDSLLYYAA